MEVVVDAECVHVAGEGVGVEVEIFVLVMRWFWRLSVIVLEERWTIVL